MSPSSIALAGAFLFVLFKILKIGSRDKSLPPGPPTLPVLGNLHVVPNTDKMHMAFTEFAQKYGDVVSLKVFSQTIILVSSASAAREVIDRSGWAASSRPKNYLVDLLTNGIKYLVFSPDAPDIRSVRKTVGFFFSKQNIARQRAPADAETAQLLYELLEKPANFITSIQRFTYSSIKIMVYGQRAPLFDVADIAEYLYGFDEAERIVSPGNYPPFDFLPILQWIPERFGPWHTACRATRLSREATRGRWYADVKKRMRSGGGDSKCYFEWVLQEHPELGEDLLSNTAMVLIDAGYDTSASFFLTLVLALASHPEYQERAQKELDTATEGRLPQLEDIEAMPFVQALIKEILRMRPPIPMGVPHASSEDLHYQGYVIPSGTTILLNIYAITNDPEVFDEPDEFKPERFLTTEFGTRVGKDEGFRDSFVFGGGRRICPGQWLARDNMNLTTMRLLWAFNFSRAIDPKTKMLIPPGLGHQSFHYKFIAAPHPFECSIEPRAGRAESIKMLFNAALPELEKFELDLRDEDKETVREVVKHR